MTFNLNSKMAPRCRFRFPLGYSGYNPDLKELLKAKREEMRMTQQKLADTIGIARPSLIAIEKGYVWPMPYTMDQLAHALELKLSEIYTNGDSGRTPRLNAHDKGADQRWDLGAALRAGRRLEKLKLRHVAETCKISVAQLSRLERGELTRSRFYQNDGQSLRFSNAEMQRIAGLAP